MCGVEGVLVLLGIYRRKLETGDILLRLAGFAREKKDLYIYRHAMIRRQSSILTSHGNFAMSAKHGKGRREVKWAEIFREGHPRASRVTFVFIIVFPSLCLLLG